MTGRALVLRGDAAHIPLPDASVDLIVTSPPFYALRSYTDGGVHYPGQIGSEPTPAAYIDTLIECTREWTRVLKPSGSMFVDLGDKYSGAQGQQTNSGLAPGGAPRSGSSAQVWARTDPPRRTGIPNKSLMLLPERYRIAAVDRLGLIARAVIIWQKPNGLPESVTDRVRRSHEDWVHLTKAPRYYSAIDEIREPHTPASLARTGRNRFAPDLTQAGVATPNTLDPAQACNPLGKLPGSVWSIPTEPLQVPAELGVQHFAAYPTEWPRRLILGWSPPGICTACGEGRRPVVDRPGLLGGDNNPHSRNGTRALSTVDGGATSWARRMADPDRIVGYACACTPYSDYPERRRPSTTPSRERRQDQDVREAMELPRRHGNDWPQRAPVRDYDIDGWTPPPTRPSVILDPFGGTGTTALVAAALGRTGISIDMSADYCRLAAWRTTDPGELAKAMRVPKPEPVGDDQMLLFDPKAM